MRTVAYFVVVSANNSPLVTPKRLKLIEELSAKTGLPILFIQNPNRKHAHDGIEWD
ncbi:MAG: hypothetical protein IPJ84_14155 [Bdellovibrionales bacterium]|nr:hypothetical protein [Bdellovibrionales bacterium]